MTGFALRRALIVFLAIIAGTSIAVVVVNPSSGFVPAYLAGFSATLLFVILRRTPHDDEIERSIPKGPAQ